jgi:hypothetical protein
VLLTLILLVGVTGLLLMSIPVGNRRLRRPPAERFRCRVGQVTEDGRLRWDPRRCQAFWQHDVLLLRFGAQTLALPVRLPEDSVRETLSRTPGGLGPFPVRLRLRLDDGRTVEVVAGAKDRARLVGPFLTAALPGMPAGPREPRRHRP